MDQNQNENNNVQIQTPVAPQKKGGVLKIFLLVGCALLVLCGIGVAVLFGGLYFGTKATRNSANEFFRLVGNNEVDKAYDSTHSKFKDAMSKSEFNTFVKENKLDKNTGVNWSSTNVVNSTATLKGTITLPDEKPEVVLELQKDGSWKVTGFVIK